jgi:hypothetical protein
VQIIDISLSYLSGSNSLYKTIKIFIYAQHQPHTKRLNMAEIKFT